MTKSNQEIYNFGAGPACLPSEVLERIRSDIPHWCEGMSIMEVSHRMTKFIDFTHEVEQNFRQLLNIPDDFAVLFMQGGARGQFSAVPMNLLQGSNTADYCVTGHWSLLAYKDAQRYCLPHLVAPIPDNFTTIPDISTWQVNPDSPYLHFTDNETIHGIEFPALPQTQAKWLVTDMTSNIMTRAIDFSKIGLIYASAQKNLGIAGITTVIVRKSLLKHAHPFTPDVLNYEKFAHTASMLNTPPVFAWYVLGLMLTWVRDQGGCEHFAQLCQARADKIHDIIDNSKGFYLNTVEKPYRSRVNIVFRMQNEDLEKTFLEAAHKAGFRQLKGHKVVGGLRASIYNAMSQAGVDRLAEFMLQFAQDHA